MNRAVLGGAAWGRVGSDARPVVIQAAKRFHREALAVVLDAKPDFVTVASVKELSELSATCALHSPAAVVLEGDRSELEVWSAVAELRDASDELWIVALYQTLDVGRAERLLDRGVDVLVPRVAGTERLVAALRSAVLEDRGAGHQEANDEVMLLTAREQDVLRLLAVGATSQQISDQLLISPKTVENHKQRVFAKLDVQSQAHAIAVAMRMGLLDDQRSVG